MHRRSALAVVLTLAVLASGCLGLVGDGPVSDPDGPEGIPGTPPGEGPAPDTTTDLRRYPDPPSTVTNATASEAAVDFEAVYVANRLRGANATNWSVATDNRTATVAGNEGGAVVVDVRVPYAYGPDGERTRTVSTATYRVGPDGIQRVEGEYVSE